MKILISGYSEEAKSIQSELSCLYDVMITKLDNEWNALILFKKIKESDLIVMELGEHTPNHYIAFGASKAYGKSIIGICSSAFKQSHLDITVTQLCDVIYTYDEFMAEINEVL